MYGDNAPPDLTLSWRGTSTSTPAAVGSLAPAWPTSTGVKKWEVRSSGGHAYYANVAGTTGPTGITLNTSTLEYDDAGSVPAITWRRVPPGVVTVQNESATVAVRVGGPDLTSTVGGLTAPLSYGTVETPIADIDDVWVYSASSVAVSIGVVPQ